ASWTAPGARDAATHPVPMGSAGAGSANRAPPTPKPAASARITAAQKNVTHTNVAGWFTGGSLACWAMGEFDLLPDRLAQSEIARDVAIHRGRSSSPCVRLQTATHYKYGSAQFPASELRHEHRFAGVHNRSMSTPILATKLYIPQPPPKVILRPRLVERLNDGLHRKLTLISAP